MNKFIKPGFAVMDRLSYQRKFMLMASLFVIPLLLFAGKLALTYHTSAEQAELSRQGLTHIQQASKLIKSLAELRDTAVISFVDSGKGFEAREQQARAKVEEQIQTLVNLPGLARHRNFLYGLKREIQDGNISPGSEAAQIKDLFQNANTATEQAYLWRLKLAYEFLSNSDTRGNATNALDFINSNNAYFMTLGETRALGSFFLQQQFLSSAGITRLDNNYTAYDQLLESLQVRTENYEKLFGNDGSERIEKLSNALRHAQHLLDDHLLQTMDLSANPETFYESISNIMEIFYVHNMELLAIADAQLAKINRQTSKQLNLFYASAATMAFLAIYLYVGFFTNVRITIERLVHSAQKVANGKYEDEISISSRDELQLLAKAMDEMRSKLKDREEELTRIGQTDGLSQLKNRKFFDEALPITLSSCTRNETPLCLVMMDIDHFKAINDTHGHQCGDFCIQQTAALFSNQFQRKTDIVARYGGEEFIAILYGTSIEEALGKTEALRMRIANKEFNFEGTKLQLTASFGLAYLPGGTHSEPKELLQACDENLYAAKKEGRNRVMSSTFDPNRLAPRAVGS